MGRKDMVSSCLDEKVVTPTPLPSDCSAWVFHQQDACKSTRRPFGIGERRAGRCTGDWRCTGDSPSLPLSLPLSLSHSALLALSPSISMSPYPSYNHLFFSSFLLLFHKICSLCITQQPMSRLQACDVTRQGHSVTNTSAKQIHVLATCFTKTSSYKQPDTSQAMT